MASIISANIDLTKIDKSKIYEGKKGPVAYSDNGTRDYSIPDTAGLYEASCDTGLPDPRKNHQGRR